MKDSIVSRVKTVVARHFGIPQTKVRLDSAFVGDLGGDALDIVELGGKFEAAFDVVLSRSERDSLTTAQDVVNFLCAR